MNASRLPFGPLLLVLACGRGPDDIAPPAEETRCDGLDGDGDGEVDEGLTTSWYRDADADGFGDRESDTVQACVRPPGYVAVYMGDCDDSDPAVNVSVADACGDSLDADCDGHPAACNEVEANESDATLWPGDAHLTGSRLVVVADIDGAGTPGLAALPGGETYIGLLYWVGMPDGNEEPSLVADLDGYGLVLLPEAAGVAVSSGYDITVRRGPVSGESTGGFTRRGESDLGVAFGLGAGRWLGDGAPGVAFRREGDGGAQEIRIEAADASGDAPASAVTNRVATGFTEGTDSVMALLPLGTPDGGDLLVVVGGNGAWILEGPLDGEHQLADAVAWVDGLFTTIAALGDIDGDGVEELGVSNVEGEDGGGVVGVWTALTSGAMAIDAAPVRMIGPAGHAAGYRLAGLGDVDGDGRDDVGITNQAWGETSGAWIVTDAPSGSTGLGDAWRRVWSSQVTYGESIHGGDLDGDGLSEVLIGYDGADNYTHNGHTDIFLATTLRDAVAIP
ncbi:MAG: hypothetical protein Q8P18_20440 [Pseudomonadota bacterium]|nr:hypothetical protein [Pseudomonadota bacterium]